MQKEPLQPLQFRSAEESRVAPDPQVANPWSGRKERRASKRMEKSI